MTLAELLEGNGQTEEQLEEERERDARKALKAGFILDRVVEQEEGQPEQEDLNAYMAQQAYRMGVTPDQLAQQITERDQVQAVVSEVTADQGADHAGRAGHRHGRLRPHRGHRGHHPRRRRRGRGHGDDDGRDRGRHHGRRGHGGRPRGRRRRTGEDES